MALPVIILRGSPLSSAEAGSCTVRPGTAGARSDSVRVSWGSAAKYHRDVVAARPGLLPERLFRRRGPMAWIRVVPLSEASEPLKTAVEAQRSLYPSEYAIPVRPEEHGGSGIVASH